MCEKLFAIGANEFHYSEYTICMLAATAPPKLLSLVFLLDSPERRVLLGKKLRGFGVGKINGFGGKQEPSETMTECAVRELQEECGIAVPPERMLARGRLKFNMLGESGMLDKQTGKIASILLVHVFSAEFSDCVPGSVVVPSDEMEPQWWGWDEVPLESMWLDDQYWLPRLLEGKDVVGDFVFKDQATILEHNVLTLPLGTYIEDPAKHEAAAALPDGNTDKENVK
jgi:8-oxo-dGTP diphosphatase